MDSVTQAVLGAGIQGALLGRVQGRRALFYGAALATCLLYTSDAADE